MSDGWCVLFWTNLQVWERNNGLYRNDGGERPKIWPQEPALFSKRGAAAEMLAQRQRCHIVVFSGEDLRECFGPRHSSGRKQNARDLHQRGAERRLGQKRRQQY